MNILINDGLSKDAIEHLENSQFKVFQTSVAQSQLLNYLNDNEIHILIVRSATKVDAQTIKAAKFLKAVGRAGVGLDNIDLDAAQTHQIKVFNTPKASAKAVAELAIAHLLTGVRHLQDANRSMPLEGEFRFKDLKKSYSSARELEGKTLGIIGFGIIGQETAKKAIGLGMRVIFHDPALTKACLNIEFYDGQELEFNLLNTSKKHLLEQSDFISLHIPSQQDYLLGEKEFKQMKKGAGLINTSRGNAIDEVALINALNTDQLAFAGLDVFESEPTPELALLMHPQLSLSPHVGGSTLEAQTRIGMDLADQLISTYKS